MKALLAVDIWFASVRFGRIHDGNRLNRTPSNLTNKYMVNIFDTQPDIMFGMSLIVAPSLMFVMGLAGVL
jgi:hypothetical protein